MSPTAVKIFEDAVAQIESKSIRAWATSDHNRSLWIQHIDELLSKGKTVDPLRLSTYMVCVAIGA